MKNKRLEITKQSNSLRLQRNKLKKDSPKRKLIQKKIDVLDKKRDDLAEKMGEKRGFDKKPKGMNNPIALATIAGSKQGQQSIGEVVTATKWLTIGLGMYFVGSYAWSKYKVYRAEKYANDNAGDAHVIAALIIHSSFTKIFDDNSWWAALLPNPTIWTDETALFSIATQIEDVQKVARAYKILFDSNLFFDVKNGMDTTEMQSFWNKINAKNQAAIDGELFPIGMDLYCAVRQGTIVNQAVKDNNNIWKGTSELYDEFSHGDFIGKVIANGIFKHPDGTSENYYIVQKYFWSFDPYKEGVVLQHQISNKK